MKNMITYFNFLLIFSIELAVADAPLALTCVKYSKHYESVTANRFSIDFEFRQKKLQKVLISTDNGKTILIKEKILHAIKESDLTNINLRKSGLNNAIYELFVVFEQELPKKHETLLMQVTLNFTKEKYIGAVAKKLDHKGEVSYEKIDARK